MHTCTATTRWQCKGLRTSFSLPARAQIGNLVGRLVAIGIDSVCIDRLLCITPDLVIAGEQPKAAGQTGVARKDVESLILLLLNEDNAQRSEPRPSTWSER